MKLLKSHSKEFSLKKPSVRWYYGKELWNRTVPTFLIKVADHTNSWSELKKKKKSTTCTLVTEPKIDIHTEEQQPIKLWSNSSSLLQALISADWHFFLQRSRERREERRRWRGEHTKILTLQHQIFWSSPQQPNHLSQKLPHQNLTLHKAFPLA